MKNFIANGETINITAAAVIASGQGVLIGSIASYVLRKPKARARVKTGTA